LNTICRWLPRPTGWLTLAPKPVSTVGTLSILVQHPGWLISQSPLRHTISIRPRWCSTKYRLGLQQACSNLPESHRARLLTRSLKFHLASSPPSRVFQVPANPRILPTCCPAPSKIMSPRPSPMLTSQLMLTASRWIPLAGLSRSNGWYILPSDPLVALPDQWLPPIRGSSTGYANCSPKPPQRRPGAGVSADSLLTLPKGAVPSVPAWARLKWS